MSKKELSGIRLMAKKLGVSTATISRALSPSTAHMVKEERRKEIIELADKLRFRPNPGARLIQRGVVQSIGVLIPRQEDVFFSEFYGRFMGGMIQSLSHTDWEVRISALKGENSDIVGELRRVALGCSGLIYAGLPLTTEQVDSLSGYHSPLILLRSTLPPDYPVDKVNCHVLGVDNYNGAITAIKYITQLGHRDLGIVLGPPDSRDFAEREKGYRDGLEKVGIPARDEMFFQGSYDQETGRAACDYFMSRDKRPTALICSSDSAAFGALYHAKDMGVSCPADLSIIGYDDGPWAISCMPRLTTIRQPLGKLTNCAANLLMQSILDPKTPFAQKIELPVVLNTRESTAYLKR
jgi:LacI family transcriptional regulator